MSKCYSRILCLNLALVVLLSFALPVHAKAPGDSDKPTHDSSAIEVPDWAIAGDAYLAEREMSEQLIELEEADTVTDSTVDESDKPSENVLSEKKQLAPSALLMSENDDSYYISVGGTSFKSNEVRSGTGWSYEDGRLTLNNYSSSGISASGDLVIYSSGSVQVRGASGTYGADGIAVSGGLDIIVESGTLRVNGGTGTSKGGDAIYANSLFCLLYGGTATFSGGSASSGTSGGHGINAGSVYAYGPGNSGTRMTATGGNAATSNSSAAAGCGIFAGNVYIRTDTNLRGGNGYTAAPAIYFFVSCEIGCVNAMLYGGRNGSYSYAKPVQFSSSSDQTWYYHPHTTLTEYNTYYSITINQYRLRLLGNGGVRGNATFTDLIAYYPTTYNLSDYTFSRYGYSQVAWTNASGDLVPLDDYYTPSTNTSLEAAWVDTMPGDILINGLSGKLEDGNYWHRYRGTSSITLPSSLNFNGESIELAGWRANLQLEEDSIGILAGAWYEAGGSISAIPTTPTSLYALKDNVGSYIIYHPTDGTPCAGGNLVVQHCYQASYTDLSVYIADGEEYLNAPEGYRFAGWSSRSNGDIQFKVGDTVTVSQGSPLHLYAVWKPIEYLYSTSGCDVWVEPTSKSIILEVKKNWYDQLEQPKTLIGAIYDEGRMIGCTVNSGGSYDKDGAISLRYTGNDLPQIKIFALNSGRGPAGQNLNIDLANMTFSGTR